MAAVAESWLGYSWQTAREVSPRVVSAVCCQHVPRKATGRIVNELWVLDCSRSDCGRVRVGSPRSRWWPRPPRVAHLYPPGTPYWEDASSVRRPIREAWVLFTGGDQAGLDRLVGRGRRFARIADPGGILDARLQEMARTGQERADAGFWRAQSLLALLFETLHAAESQGDGTFTLVSAEAPDDHSGELIRNTHEYFRAHLGDKVTLAAVARHLGMSSSAFSHRYSEQAGRSPMASLTAMRIELAKSLLLRGLKMEAVARQTGFFDAFHFSKAFKKCCGMSPSRFRRDSWQSAQ